MILFLDYDGVLHPDAVYLLKGRPVLRSDGELFQWAGLLGEALADRANVRIVLSTSWVQHLKFTKAKSYLPEPLSRRVIGATWHTSIDRQEWEAMTRYQQIRRYVDRAGLVNWIAVDDDAEGWADVDRERLVHTNGSVGLSALPVLENLTRKLGGLC